ncbi:hypothetical protein GXB81_06420 [Paraburkholderia sp. Ac-20336]|uniref:hypothetical protein n=1 Tax=Burkholderiaceae TaxID=119060 RepID=UPI0014207064|nr:MULTISPECIES: hypothetical protein [Burkholderiaceae]MBN3802690.1 hypothetical protein [Paraburkholderia sp. Ac-20336]NIF51868.1 hypothetical protein [Burkholderia sp. Ax-1724]NIF78472.1 hypothetical protein [Paraburkholderia sp. Cy-641]
MNSRKIKTSRTFYGKSGVSDPLAPFASPPYPASTLLCSGFEPEVSQKKTAESAAKMPNQSDIFDPNQSLKCP